MKFLISALFEEETLHNFASFSKTVEVADDMSSENKNSLDREVEFFLERCRHLLLASPYVNENPGLQFTFTGYSITKL